MKPMKFIVFLLVFLPFGVLGETQVENQGHRGTGSNSPINDFPENTIPSFLQAFAEGADMVELDCQLSQDDEVVVIHDATLDRTTDCTGSVSDMTRSQIQDDPGCDAGVGTPYEGQGVIVPTLGQVFSSLEEEKHQGFVNVEIKGDGVGASHMALRVTEEIVEAGWESGVIISSFRESVLDEVELLDTAWITALITSEVNVNAQADMAAASGFDGLHPYYMQTFAANVDYAHGLGLFVNVWTVNLKPAMNAVIERGVDGIITDEPDRLSDILFGDDDDDDNDDDNNDDDDNHSGDDDAIDDDEASNDDDSDDDTLPEEEASEKDDEDDGCCG